ncbi:HEPN domain-containing protein [Clostridium sp. 001]|uniref:HEPN domain-containing protein n=1 Tax=Clostridium sp. 001 TaxID=1970093 RepID=UPI001C2C43D3|nr:HEPN domain-containing protein [Clostridium sp. 001]
MENLLQKSEDNFKTASWAESNNFYDAAVSRYYYSLYEKIIYISKKKGFYTEPPKGQDSHVFIINQFTNNLSSTLPSQDTAKLSSMFRLKKSRAKADYREYKINSKNEFNLVFKFFFNSINEVLDNLI